jgi:hypothetical protein
MDQFQAWADNEPAGPGRETWDEAAQDAVSAGLATWVPDCIATAIDWSTAPAFISRTRTGNEGAAISRLRFEVHQTGHSWDWVVLVGGKLYGQYLSREEAVLDALEAAEDARQSGRIAEVTGADSLA